VNAHDAILLEHVATAQYLANDQIPYQNLFGGELEVSCMALATKAKTQILLNEAAGTMVRENIHKAWAEQNLWKFQLAKDASESEVSFT
jgi:hypothetical protein